VIRTTAHIEKSPFPLAVAGTTLQIDACQFDTPYKLGPHKQALKIDTYIALMVFETV
jgi:hypothetical protein